MTDPASEAALRAAITQHYTRLITTGQMGPREQLPSMEKIGKKFRISPRTAWKALQPLVEAGLVYSTPAGTFVSEPVRSVTPTALAARELGQNPAQRWEEHMTHLTADVVTNAPGYVLALWDLPEGTAMGRRESVTTYRGTQRLTVSWHPPHIVALCPELVATPAQPIEHGTLHLVVDRLGHWDHLFAGKDYMRARWIYAREARLLGVRPRTPALAIVGDRRDGEGLLEFVECAYPMDTVVEYDWVWQRQR